MVTMLCPGSGLPPVKPGPDEPPLRDHVGVCGSCGASVTSSTKRMASHEPSDRPADAANLGRILQANARRTFDTVEAAAAEATRVEVEGALRDIGVLPARLVTSGGYVNLWLHVSHAATLAERVDMHCHADGPPRHDH